MWATVKHINSSLEKELDSNSNNECFYTPPGSPSESISAETESHIHANRGIRRSKNLLDYHESITHQMLNTGTPGATCPPWYSSCCFVKNTPETTAYLRITFRIKVFRSNKL
jgi:hypothetical protein